jgi:phosphatidylglycerophosphate synthase
MMDGLAYGRTGCYSATERYLVRHTARDAVLQAGVVGVTVTVVRLAMVPIMVAAFMSSSVLTASALMVFVLADLQDGIVARRRGTDGPARRALDSTVDRIAIDVCLVAACLDGALSPILLSLFLARDLYCAGICQRMMRMGAAAIKADWLYRGLNLSVAAWAMIAPFVSFEARQALFALISVGAFAVTLDLTDAVRQVIATPSLHGTVTGAGVLRGARRR